LCIHGKETLCQENADRKQEKFPAAKSGPTSKHQIREEKLQKDLRIREKKTYFPATRNWQQQLMSNCKSKSKPN
jgi:hypothetical protein